MLFFLRQMSLEKRGESRRRTVARLSISSTLHLHSDRSLSAREFQPAGRSVHITTNFRITASDSVSKYLTAQFSGYLSRTVHGDKFGFTHMMIHVIYIYSVALLHTDFLSPIMTFYSVLLIFNSIFSDKLF